jgi:hypothetical protein
MAVKGDAVTRNEQLNQAGVLKVDRTRWQLAQAQFSVLMFRYGRMTMDDIRDKLTAQ